MKKNSIANHPILFLLFAIFYFPIGVIFALAKKY